MTIIRQKLISNAINNIHTMDSLNLVLIHIKCQSFHCYFDSLMDSSLWQTFLDSHLFEVIKQFRSNRNKKISNFAFSLCQTSSLIFHVFILMNYMRYNPLIYSSLSLCKAPNKWLKIFNQFVSNIQLLCAPLLNSIDLKSEKVFF